MRLTSCIALLLAGCATQGQPAPVSGPARPATAETVQGCTYLDTVASVSSRYGIFAASALEDTRAQALAKAGALGGTHLVWDAQSVAHGATTSSGKVYRCP
jgi:hypothetical protein